MTFSLLAGTYFLVDEDIIVTVLVLVGKVLLHLSQRGSLFEKLPVNRQLFSFGDLSLSDKSKQLSSLFELFPQFLEFLCALGVSATSLANLPDFSSAEAHVWIPIVRFCSSFELQEYVS